MSVSIKQLKRVAPLRTLPEAVLGYIARQSKRVKLVPGKELYRLIKSTNITPYLLQGDFVVISDKGEEHEIQLDAEHMSYALPAKEHADIQVFARSKCDVVKVPTEIINMVEMHWNKETAEGEIELSEGGAENKIYVEFYDNLQRGECILPGIPNIAFQVRKAVADTNTGAADISRIIQVDPALTARIIRVANSAAFSGQFPIVNCLDAVTRLGLERTRDLVTSFVMKDLFHSKSQLLKTRMMMLWKHSRRVAAICYVFARRTTHLDPDRALLAGLLHDIGAIPILGLAHKYPEIENSPQLLEQVINSLQDELGAMVLRKWGFQSELVQAALHAEHWLRDHKGPPDFSDIVIAAQIHAYVGLKNGYNLPPLYMIPAHHKLALEKLGPEFSFAILEEAREEIEAVEQLLEG
jgi:HD-like signal output (HDOD) protein